MRAVLDPNVLISALLSPAGSPARILGAWTDGQFDLIVSPLLLAELRRALGYPKLRNRIPAPDAEAFVAWLERTAVARSDPSEKATVQSVDPGDDYLIALAQASEAVLVSGDDHLLSVVGQLPIYSPRRFLEILSG